MNMFARFDKNPAMNLQDIKKKNVMDGRTHGRTDGQRENSIPTTNKVCGGYKLQGRLIIASRIFQIIHKCICKDNQLIRIHSLNSDIINHDNEIVQGVIRKFAENSCLKWYM